MKNIILLILCIIISSCSTQEIYKIACLGDSITDICDYPEELNRLFVNENVVVHNYGMSGQITEQINDRLIFGKSDTSKKTLAINDYDLIIILAGVNDINREIDMSNIKQNIISMLSKIHQTDTRVVFLTLLPWGMSSSWNISKQNNTENINIFIKSLNTDGCLDTYYLFQNNHNSYNMIKSFTTDGVHPNIQGSHYLAKQIYDMIQHTPSLL